MSLYRIARLLTIAAALLPLTGCYLMQAAGGQMEIASKREPITEVLADSATPPKLRTRLEYVAAARDFASRELGRRGDDVAVGGVAAYSTLGHFKDPVLSTMLGWSDAQLAGTLFHELAH